MTNSDKIREYIKSNPGATNKEISTTLGIKISSVASVTTTDTHRGLLDRAQVGTTLSGIPVYGYTAKTEPKKTFSRGKTTRKRTASRQENAPVISADAAIQVLAQAIADQVLAQVKDQIAMRLTEALPQLTPQAPVGAQLPTVHDLLARRPIEQEAQRLRKVVIVGLLPQQAGFIQTEFSDCFDLSFFDQVTSPKSLVSTAKRSDHVLLHITHMRHSVEDALKSAGIEFIRVTGGMSQMRDTLTELYAGDYHA